MTDTPPKDPQVRIIDLRAPKPKPSASVVAWTIAFSFLLTILVLTAAGYLGQMAYENVTGDDVTFTQAANAAVLVFLAGLLFNWRNR